MSLFSWFNSADQVDTALVVVAIIGAIIEVVVAVAAVINVHKELEAARKEKLEKYIEIFACVAAFFFLAEAILGCRSSTLLSKEIEKFKGDNLVLQTNVASLNGAVIELAHQYDLSTNALAEANMRILSASNAAAMNSPRNLPLKTLEGDCFIGIGKNDSAPFIRALTKPVLLTFLKTDDNIETGIGILGHIEYVQTNYPSGEVVLSIGFNGERGKSPGAWSGLSFNDLHVVKLDLSSVSESRFVIKGGFARIEVDSLFNSEFGFPVQTNRIGSDWGIVGFKRSEWP